MKFCTTVKQSNIHFITSLVEIYWKMPNLCYFNQDKPHFSAFQALSSRVVCWYLWKEPICWWWDEDADLQTNRVIADAWSDHHWQPQPRRPSGEDRHHLVDDVLKASLPKWSTKRLSTHQLSYASAGVYGTFPAWCPRCDSPVSSNLESLGARAVFSMNLFAFLSLIHIWRCRRRG